MGDRTLETVTEEKDLGVIIDEKLKFDKHTEVQANKANKVLGLLRRSFETLDKETLVWLFRPHLEYCNTVTYPVYEKDAKLLEGVQRRVTKMVPEMKNYYYATKETCPPLTFISSKERGHDRDINTRMDCIRSRLCL